MLFAKGMAATNHVPVIHISTIQHGCYAPSCIVYVNVACAPDISSLIVGRCLRRCPRPAATGPHPPPYKVT